MATPILLHSQSNEMHISKGDEHVCIRSSKIYVPGNLVACIANKMIPVVDSQDTDLRADRPDLVIATCGKKYSPLGQTTVNGCWINEQ